MAIHVRQADVTMRLVDGEALTPQQMQRIVDRVVAELRRSQDDERSRLEDTRVAGSSCEQCAGDAGSHA